MKITTDRFEYCELTEQDISPISNIIRDMAWNDTINILLENNKELIDKFSTKGLSTYQEIIQMKAKIAKLKQQMAKRGSLQQEKQKKIPLSVLISQDLIPQEYWHINFSILKPDFFTSACTFVNKAIEKRKEQSRTGYWFSIKNKKTGELIGGTMFSTKVIPINGILVIGHSGQFIHPTYQQQGIISETKAVMVDFMYKYLIDNQKADVPNNAKFYTTCDVLNRGSRKLQEKSGATCINPDCLDARKLLYMATREEITHSALFSKHILWQAELDNGTVFKSMTGSLVPAPKKLYENKNLLDF